MCVYIRETLCEKVCIDRGRIWEHGQRGVSHALCRVVDGDFDSSEVGLMF